MIEVKSIVYWSRIMPTVDVCEVCELTIRTVADTYFVGVEKKERHAYLFSYSAIGKTIFATRKEALEKIKTYELSNR